MLTSETITIIVIQLLNGLAYSMLLFLLAAGLSLIFGMMDVINLAHGSFYMLGAYVGLFLLIKTGSFPLAAVLAPLIVGIAGLLIESTLLRAVYKRGHLDQVLLTFGFVFILADLVKWVWGADVQSLNPPLVFAHSVNILGGEFPAYRLFIIGFGIVLALILWFILEKTRLGMVVRAGVSDKEMVSGLGINITLVFSLVFAFGVALAALSGVIAGPVLGLYPGMDFEVLIITLVVVVVGGLGTLAGSFWGALLIGMADTFGRVFFPNFSMFMIFAVMALVLLVKPSGLFGKGGA